MNELNVAQKNLETLALKEYLGRGMVMGMVGDYNAVQIYWISGRSEGSRNRVLKTNKIRVWTEVANSAKEKGNPDLTLYDAMGYSINGLYVVSNGKQTQHLSDILSIDKEEPISNILKNYDYEPDRPNFTPRISGVLLPHRNLFVFSVIKKSPLSDESDRQHFEYRFPSGFGRCITTYRDNASPGEGLPSFRGEPITVPIPASDPEKLFEYYWSRLNNENMVSMVIRYINFRTKEDQIMIRNNHNFE